jgi:hypothetical protein
MDALKAAWRANSTVAEWADRWVGQTAWWKAGWTVDTKAVVKDNRSAARRAQLRAVQLAMSKVVNLVGKLAVWKAVPRAGLWAGGTAPRRVLCWARLGVARTAGRRESAWVAQWDDWRAVPTGRKRADLMVGRTADCWD